MGLFKDINVGAKVYYLDKAVPKTGIGYVKGVSQPHYQSTPAGAASMVVDVSISIDDVEKVYTMQDNLSVAYAGELILATESGAIVDECSKLKSVAEESLAKADYYKSVVASYDGLVLTLNPEAAGMKEMGDRLAKLEASVAEILGLIKEKNNG